jgi:hypothetical protein
MADFSQIAGRALDLAAEVNAVVGLPGGAVAIGIARLVVPVLDGVINQVGDRDASLVSQLIGTREELHKAIRQAARDEAESLR